MHDKLDGTWENISEKKAYNTCNINLDILLIRAHFQENSTDLS